MKARAVVSLLVLSAIVLSELADAHALLVRTSPPRRAVLRDAPKQVQLWFNERLEPAYASVTVSNQSGTEVSAMKAAVEGEDRKGLSLRLPPLEPGTYTVRFRVLSVDGHLAEDSFAFSVRGK